MLDSPFRFGFDEVVRIVTDDPELAEVNGECGAVCGRTDDGSAYGVFVYRDRRVWHVEEHCLETTGAFDRRDEPAHTVRVRVDEKGRGHIVGPASSNPRAS